MKRFLSILISTAVLLSATAMVGTPIYAADTESGIVSLMNALKIMEGDGNGNMELDRAVTRAEIAKSQYRRQTRKTRLGSD